MRRLLAILAAAACLAPATLTPAPVSAAAAAAQEQTPGAPSIGYPRAAGVYVPGGVASGQPTAISVLSNGWQANVTLHSVACAGATSAYGLTPDATPKLTLAVTSPGFTVAGAATTIARTIEGTSWLRQAYPNYALPTETQSGPDCVVTVTLSDFLNNTDTATASFITGAYVSGGVTSTQTSALPVTNSSTRAHDVPICNWVTPGYQVFASGAESSTAVEVACFHARMQNAKQVQAVKITWSDGTNTASCTTSTMVQSTLITTGNPVYVYRCAPANGSFASLTGGLVTRDFTAYPIVGDQTVQASIGQDGVGIAATVITPNLHPLQDEWDSAGKYSPVYGWICAPGNDTTSGCAAGATGTCATVVCISTSSTDPGASASANYASAYTFANNCKSYNNANRSHNDTAGCVGIIRKIAAMNGFDTTTNLSTLTVGNTWLKFQAAPGQGPSTVVLTRASSSTGTASIANRTEFDNVGIVQLDTTSSTYNEEIVGGDTTQPVATEIVCNGCAITTKVPSAIPAVYRIGLVHWINTNGTLTGAVLGTLSPFGTQPDARVVLGGVWNPGNTVWCYLCLGFQMTTGQVSNPGNGSANYFQATGRIEAFLTLSGQAPITEGGGNTAANVANVQNVIEKTTVDGSFAERVYADGDTTQITNYLRAYSTVAGGRWNWMYNETSSSCTVKQGVRLFNVLDPMSGQGFNSKTDTTTATGVSPNGARICNWVDRYGVGAIGNIALSDANGNFGPTASGSPATGWMGEYWGLIGSFTANNEGYNQSVSFSSNASASGTNSGGGNYKPTGSSSSPAYGRVPSGGAGLPFDITGMARRNDGTGCAGAYEC
jgi:hypothetical protein